MGSLILQIIITYLEYKAFFSVSTLQLLVDNQFRVSPYWNELLHRP